jgi:hypothetical protein
MEMKIPQLIQQAHINGRQTGFPHGHGSHAEGCVFDDLSASDVEWKV